MGYEILSVSQSELNVVELNLKLTFDDNTVEFCTVSVFQPTDIEVCKQSAQNSYDQRVRERQMPVIIQSVVDELRATINRPA